MSHVPEGPEYTKMQHTIIVCCILVYSGPSGSLLKYKNAVFNFEQEKLSIICVKKGRENQSLGITDCHHSAH